MKKKQMLMLMMVVLLAANMRAPFTGVGSLTTLIRADLGVSNTVMGLLTTIPMVVFAVVSLLATPISRRIGLGRTLTLALALILIGELVRSFTNTAGLFLGTGLLCVGIGLENVLLVSLIKLRFSDNPAPATSAYSTTMALTAAISIGIGVWLAQDVGLGWRGALVIWAVVAVAALAVWLPQSRRPENQTPPETQGTSCMKALLRSARTWELAVFMGTMSTLFYCITAWGPTILQDKGFTMEQASAAATFLQIVSLPITMAAPLLTRRFPVKRMLVVLNALYLVGGALYYLGQERWMVYLGMLMLAQGMGCGFSFCILFYSLRTRTAVEAATLSGIAQCGGYLLAAVGPVLMGKLADYTGAWDLPVLFLGIMLVVMIVTSLMSAREGYILEE